MRVIAVRWTELETAVERNAPDTESFLDTRTGEVLTLIESAPNVAELRSRVMSGGDAYHVAFRKLKDGSITFGCSCKDWIFRRQHTGECCKHQMAFIAGGSTHGTDSGKVKVWPTKAGLAARAVLCAATK